MKKLIPAGWLPNDEHMPPATRRYVSVFEDRRQLPENRTRLLISKATCADGSQWWHLSVSVAGNKVPSWETLSRIKDEWLGEEVEAYQVLAKRSEHVNIANCLHLWAPVDGKRRVANLHDLVLEERI